MEAIARPSMKTYAVFYLALTPGLLATAHDFAPPDGASGRLVQRDEVEAPTRADNDDQCSVFQKQIPDPLGADKLIWVPAFPDASVHQCTRVCGDAVAKKIEQGQIGSTNCISNNGEIDWQPYYGE